LTKSKAKPKASATAKPKSAYRLAFVPPALKEWNALDGSVKELFRTQLRKRLVNPYVPGSELYGGLKNCYKIKLRKQGYRLVYAVDDGVLTLLVLAVGKREDFEVYDLAINLKALAMTSFRFVGLTICLKSQYPSGFQGIEDTIQKNVGRMRRSLPLSAERKTRTLNDNFAAVFAGGSGRP
jgi:mRNA interferase RelE/StbE